MNGTGRLCGAMVIVLSAAVLSPAEVVVRRWGQAPRSAAKAKPVIRARGGPPTGYVVETKTAPVIDGKLDDRAWAAASPLVLARTLNGAGPSAQPTQVRLLHDGKTLYIAFRCTEPQMAKVKAARRAHDGPVWSDDSVEFFLGLGGDYYHFGVNPAGSTYDGRGKDKSWDSRLRAAAAKAQRQWTAEIALPLKAITGGRKPAGMTANFNRNRRVTGVLEETAWSPTYSGDSHVPQRFGRLLFEPPPAATGRARQDKPAATKATVEVRPCEGGEGVVRFDLSSIPKGARIHQADLLVFRTSPITGRDEDALADIEVYPLWAAYRGGRPKADGKPLQLREPWFDRFDATDAVRQWASGKTNGGFFVKTCPRFNAEATCLDVAYEGKPKNVPPQVTGLKVFHRAGQTFITWKEIEDLAGADNLKWEQLKSLLQNMDRQRQVRYVVYRSDRTITAATLHQALPIAEVKPLSCWNANGRNVERPIDVAIATAPVLKTGQGNPFGKASPDGEYGLDCPIDRLVIADGEKPLPRGTGLYVHTPSGAAKAYYAVVTCVDGVQNTADFSAANTTAKAVAETAGAGEPILQGVLPASPIWNYPQKRLHYVRWVSPPLVNLPSQYYNWSVGVPNTLGKAVPLELNLHRDNGSYWRTQYRLERNSIVLSPHDFPLRTWWYGYHERHGTLKSFRQGTIHNYTQRRLLSFVDWAAKQWPVDRNRIIVTGVRFTGGTGALHLGVKYPEVFSLVVTGHGMPDMGYYVAVLAKDRRSRGRFDGLEALWGRINWDIKTSDGENVWDALNLNRLLGRLPPNAELPLVAMTSRRDWKPCHRFYLAMIRKRHAIMGSFMWGGTKLLPVSATSTWPGAIRQEVRKDGPLIAFKGAAAEALLTSNKQGEFNWNYRWRTDDVVDKADRCAVTVFYAKKYGGGSKPTADVTIRRLKNFKVTAGKTYHLTVGPAGQETKGKEGSVTVGEDGLLTIPAVEISGAGTRLVVKAK